MDLYPTLCDLAGIPTPAHTDGSSLRPVIDDPDAEWSELAFSQFPSPALREWGAFPLPAC